MILCLRKCRQEKSKNVKKQKERYEANIENKRRLDRERYAKKKAGKDASGTEKSDKENIDYLDELIDNVIAPVLSEGLLSGDSNDVGTRVPKGRRVQDVGAGGPEELEARRENRVEKIEEK